MQEKIQSIDRIFLAPELKKRDPRVTSNTAFDKSDTFSFGAILYVLVTGGKLDSINERDVFQFKEEPWSHVSEELQEFVSVCLTREPDQRPALIKLKEEEFMTIYKSSQKSLDRTPYILEDHDENSQISCYKL